MFLIYFIIDARPIDNVNLDIFCNFKNISSIFLIIYLKNE